VRFGWKEWERGGCDGLKRRKEAGNGEVFWMSNLRFQSGCMVPGIASPPDIEGAVIKYAFLEPFSLG
jgi:hypothetical protein